jgi:hypothetical protein
MTNERDYLIVSIKAFLTRSGSPWDWNNFTSHALRDAELDRIRRCAAAVDLPLDAQGEATLQDLLDQAELASGDDPAAPRPWRLEAGLAIGLMVGAGLWWLNYLPGAGLFHNLHLLIVPPAAGAFIVIQRNSRKQVGAYDPRIVAQNRKGRV